MFITLVFTWDEDTEAMLREHHRLLFDDVGDAPPFLHKDDCRRRACCFRAQGHDLEAGDLLVRAEVHRVHTIGCH